MGLLVCIGGCASQQVVKPVVWNIKPKKDFQFQPVLEKKPSQGASPEVVVLARKPSILWVKYVQELLESPSFSKDWYQVITPVQLSAEVQQTIEKASTKEDLVQVGLQRKARATVVIDDIQTPLGPRVGFWFYNAMGKELGEVLLLRENPEETGKELRQLLLRTWNVVGLPETAYRRGVLLLPFEHQKRVEQIFGLWSSKAPQVDFYWYRVPGWLVEPVGCGKSAQCLKETYKSLFWVNATTESGQLVLFTQTPWDNREDKPKTLAGPYRHSVLLGQVLSRLYTGLRDAVALIAGPVGRFTDPEDENRLNWEWNTQKIPMDPLLTYLEQDDIVAKGIPVLSTALPPAVSSPPPSATILPIQGKDMVVTWFDAEKNQAIGPTSATKQQRQFLEQVGRALQAQPGLSINIVANTLWKPFGKNQKKEGILSAQWPVLAVRYDKQRKKEASPSRKIKTVMVLSLFLCNERGQPLVNRRSTLEVDPAQVVANAEGKSGKKTQIIKLSVETNDWLKPIREWIQ